MAVIDDLLHNLGLNPPLKQEITNTLDTKRIGMKRTFTDLLKQMIPVIMGILIALFINGWNEQRKDRNYITKIIQSIGQELTESKKAIAKDMPD